MKMKHLALCAFVLTSNCLAQAEKPNFIFILADDLGWRDVGYNGCPFYDTPHFDQLTADGMRFDRGYSGGPNCAPSRACLISGTYTPRHKIYTPSATSKGKSEDMRLLVPNRKNKRRKDLFDSLEDLDPAFVSVAEMLKTEGYQTAMIGKWHLGEDEQGFDLFSADGTDAPYKKSYGDPEVTKQLSIRAKQFMQENRERPFFLYVPHWNVHGPNVPPKELNSKYKKRLKSRDWEEKWSTQYAGCVEAFDDSIGQIRAEVKRLGLEENTLIIVSSDNGVTSGKNYGPLKGSKGSLYEAGIRVPTAMVWPGVIQPGSVCKTPINFVDFLPTFAELASAQLPTTQPVDGESIVPLLHGDKAALENRAIFWHYPLYLETPADNAVINRYGSNQPMWRAAPSTLIMKGKWKLMHFYEDNSIRLYNVEDDLSEDHEISKTHPEVAETLLAELREWTRETDAPIPTKLNPDFVPTTK